MYCFAYFGNTIPLFSRPDSTVSENQYRNLCTFSSSSYVPPHMCVANNFRAGCTFLDASRRTHRRLCGNSRRRRSVSRGRFVKNHFISIPFRSRGPGSVRHGRPADDHTNTALSRTTATSENVLCLPHEEHIVYALILHYRRRRTSREAVTNSIDVSVCLLPSPSTSMSASASLPPGEKHVCVFQSACVFMLPNTHGTHANARAPCDSWQQCQWRITQAARVGGRQMGRVVRCFAAVDFSTTHEAREPHTHRNRWRFNLFCFSARPTHKMVTAGVVAPGTGCNLK